MLWQGNIVEVSTMKTITSIHVVFAVGTASMVRGMQDGIRLSGIAVTVGTIHGIGTMQAGTILGITAIMVGIILGIWDVIGDGMDGTTIGMVRITDGVV